MRLNIEGETHCESIDYYYDGAVNFVKKQSPATDFNDIKILAHQLIDFMNEHEEGPERAWIKL